MKRCANVPFQPGAPPIWYGPLGYFAAVIGVAFTTGVLWLAQPFFSLGSVYLVFLIVVVGVAVGWGWKQAFLASILAFLAANFFFTRPIFTFTVVDPQDVLALVIFLGLATLTSHLVARLQQEAREAHRGQQVTATLYALSQTINRQHNLKKLLDEVCLQLCAVLQLEACTITIRDPESTLALTSSAGQFLKEDERNANVLRVNLDAGTRQVGALRLRFPNDRRHGEGEEQLIAAFAEQLQSAVDRDRLRHIEVETEVLRRSDALRAALLSAVAHDLRTPFASIKMAATSLLEPFGWSADDQSAFLKTIVGEVDRLDRLATNLLDMSRIEAGKLRPHKELHGIKDVIDTVIERLAPVLATHAVSTDIEPDLPAVPMDVVEIDEVLTNLLENANKYTPPGTQIHVYGRYDRDVIRVEVEDEGPGIPTEHLPYLFDRFYRVTTGAEGAGGAKGSGLGLAIVKGIIDAHGGQVSVGNRAGRGAVFSFTLPVQPVDQKHGREKQPAIGSEALAGAVPLVSQRSGAALIHG